MVIATVWSWEFNQKYQNIRNLQTRKSEEEEKRKKCSIKRWNTDHFLCSLLDTVMKSIRDLYYKWVRNQFLPPVKSHNNLHFVQTLDSMSVLSKCVPGIYNTHAWALALMLSPRKSFSSSAPKHTALIKMTGFWVLMFHFCVMQRYTTGAENRVLSYFKHNSAEHLG